MVITDDHQIVIDGLTAALNNYPHLEIVGTATSGPATMSLLQRQQTDLLISDVMMPGMDGRELAQAVKEAFPQVRIIALSMNGDGAQVEKMAPYIDGYLLKQCGVTELVNALKIVAEGGTYFDASVQEEKLRYKRSQQFIKDTGITPREKQIILLMEKSYSNKEISSQLCISTRTVETHRKNILRKTGTNNLLTLMKWAYEQNIL